MAGKETESWTIDAEKDGWVSEVGEDVPQEFYGYPCGLSRETRGRILRLEQAAEERACTGLHVASEKISPFLRASARLLDKYIVFPLISAPLKIGALMGTLWCNGVNAIFSYIPKPESRIYRISGTVFFHAAWTSGYILWRVSSLLENVLEKLMPK